MFAVSLINDTNEFTSSTEMSWGGALGPPTLFLLRVGSIGPNSAFFTHDNRNQLPRREAWLHCALYRESER